MDDLGLCELGGVGVGEACGSVEVCELGLFEAEEAPGRGGVDQVFVGGIVRV